MSRAVYEDDVIKLLNRGLTSGMYPLAYDVRALPSAQPEPKKGEWIKISPARIYECSKCGKNVMTNDIEAYNFCHGCGADMRGKQDE